MSYLGKPKTILAILFFLFVTPNVIGQELPDSLQLLEEKIGTIDSDQELLKLYVTLAGKLTPVDPDKGVFYSNEALLLAEKLNDINAYAEACIAMAINLINVGKPDSSMYFSRKALNLDDEDKIEGFKFYALNSLGNAHNDLENIDSAFYYYNLVIENVKTTNKQSQMAAAYNNIGMLLSTQGDMENCYKNYLSALKIFEQIGDEENISTTLNNIATVNQVNEDYRKSIEYLNRAAEINKRNNYNQSLSMNYSNLGIAYKNLESYDTALYFYEKAIEINQRYCLEHDLTRDYFNVGNLYLEKENYESARKYLEISMAESEKYGVKMGVLYNHLQLSKIDIIQGKLNIAEARLKDIDRLIQETGQAALKENALYRKSSFYEKKGELKKALAYYRQYHDFSDSLQKLSYKGNIADMQEKYETEKKSRENQELRDQNLLHKKTIQNQRLLGLVIIITLFFVILLLITFLRNSRKLKRAFESLKLLNKEVLLQKGKLEVSNREKDKLFSIIAHDLRSPFNSLMGFLDVLIMDFEEMEDDEKKKMLGVVNDQSVKTFGLLENLLQWSMLQRGMLKPLLGKHKLHQVINSQIIELSARSNEKNIRIYNYVGEEQEAVFDVDMAKSVFRNLINNAIKFSHKGGEIKIESKIIQEHVVVSVIDNGIGMSKQHAGALFGESVVESQLGTFNEKGSGLGLQIVKDFAEMMNAKISVSSEAGKGSVFAIGFNRILSA